MKLGVICDGISRDLEHTVTVMNEFDLTYAELQFVWDHEVGDHSAEEIKKIDQICRDNGKPVSCLSRHIFAGMSTENRPGDALHQKHMDALKRVVDMAHVVGSPLVRIMTQKKEQILWGHNGAEQWNVAKGCLGYNAPHDRPRRGFRASGGRDIGRGNGQWDHGEFQLHGPQTD